MALGSRMDNSFVRRQDGLDRSCVQTAGVAADAVTNKRDSARVRSWQNQRDQPRKAPRSLPEGELDFAHYRTIHHHLFQDVYAWAGNIRTVRLAKGGSAFCFPENIEAQANKLFDDLKAARFLAGLSQNDFAKTAAHFLAEL